MRSDIGRIFYGNEVSGRILPIGESGDAKHPVAIGASRITAEGNGEPLECKLLLLKVESFHTPEDLVLVRQSGKDGESRRHRSHISPHRPSLLCTVACVKSWQTLLWECRGKAVDKLMVFFDCEVEGIRSAAAVKK